VCWFIVNYRNYTKVGVWQRCRHLPDYIGYLSMLCVKFYGPRIGALYVRRPGQKTPLYPMFYGGGQERSFRPG